jgi:hypothetical protein
MSLGATPANIDRPVSRAVPEAIGASTRSAVRVRRNVGYRAVGSGTIATLVELLTMISFADRKMEDRKMRREGSGFRVQGSGFRV